MEMQLQLPVDGTALPARIAFERPLTDEELMVFSAQNHALRIEREPNGDLSIMSPAVPDAGHIEAEVLRQLANWAIEDGAGEVFSSAAGFTLPDGALRSPDASFIAHARWSKVALEQRRKFTALCPDFVIEVRSPSDRLKALQNKMQEWIANGAQLAWLIDTDRRTIEVYRPGQEQPDIHEAVTSVHGDGPVAGFVFETARLWS